MRLKLHHANFAPTCFSTFMGYMFLVQILDNCAHSSIFSLFILLPTIYFFLLLHKITLHSSNILFNCQKWNILVASRMKALLHATNYSNVVETCLVCAYKHYVQPCNLIKTSSHPHYFPSTHIKKVLIITHSSFPIFNFRLHTFFPLFHSLCSILLVIKKFIVLLPSIALRTHRHALHLSCVSSTS